MAYKADSTQNYANIVKYLITNDMSKFPIFVTGSRIIGGYTEHSDFDIVCNIDNRRKFYNIMTEYSSKSVPSDYNLGTKFIIDDACFNLIPLHPLDFCGWLFATNTLHYEPSIGDRDKRHRAFEMAVLLFKSFLCNNEHSTIEGSTRYYSLHSKDVQPNMDMFYKSIIDKYDYTKYF